MFETNVRLGVVIAGHTALVDPEVRTWSAAAPQAASNALRVRSSESGIRCPYVLITKLALRWPRRSATATTDSPAKSSTLA